MNECFLIRVGKSSLNKVGKSEGLIFVKVQLLALTNPIY